MFIIRDLSQVKWIGFTVNLYAERDLYTARWLMCFPTLTWLYVCTAHFIPKSHRLNVVMVTV